MFNPLEFLKTALKETRTVAEEAIKTRELAAEAELFAQAIPVAQLISNEFSARVGLPGIVLTQEALFKAVDAVKPAMMLIGYSENEVKSLAVEGRNYGWHMIAAALSGQQTYVVEIEEKGKKRELRFIIRDHAKKLFSDYVAKKEEKERNSSQPVTQKQEIKESTGTPKWVEETLAEAAIIKPSKSSRSKANKVLQQAKAKQESYMDFEG